MEKKIPLKIIGLSSSQTQMGSYALVLGELDGSRRLPIIIGGFEAQAIALEVENIKPNRPMTHDLILSIAKGFDIDLIEVVISDLKEGIFYSRLVLTRGNEIKEIDARPSDAIAIAVRYKAPIYTYGFILEEAGIIIREADPKAIDEEQESEIEPETELPVTKSTASNTPQSKQQKIKTLTERIQEAIDREDYEEAARLRDEVNKLEKS